MKKVLSVLVMACFLFATLSAQEEEKKPSRFSPSGSIGDKTVINTVRSGEDNASGNYSNDSLRNDLTANFGVGIKILDNFSLRPQIRNLFRTTASGINQNKVSVGLSATYSPLDMLTLSLTPLYYSQYKANDKLNVMWNGVNLTAMASASVEPVFLDFTLMYIFDASFSNAKRASDDTLKRQAMWHDIYVEASFDFLSFAKEGLGGMALSSEAYIQTGKSTGKDGVESSSFYFQDEIALAFNINPVESISASFATKFTPSMSKAYDAKDKKWQDPEKGFDIALGMGLNFSRNRFKVGFEYSPTVYSQATDAKGKTEVAKNLGHEVSVSFSVGF